MNNYAYDLTFTLERGAHTATPAAPQAAGTVGDDRAARLTFLLTDAPEHRLYRLEMTDGCGGYDVSELLEAVNNTLTYAVPAAWTAAGTATLRVVEIAVTDGVEQMVYHYPPVGVTFDDREEGEALGETATAAWQQTLTDAELAEQERRRAEESRESRTAAAIAGCENAAEAAQSVVQNAPVIVNGEWYLGDTPTGVQAKGTSGLPRIAYREMTDDNPNVLLHENEELHCQGAVTHLRLLGFFSDSEAYSQLWSVQFTTGDAPLVEVPDSVVWAVAEPVFEAYRTYWLSFVPFGERHLGIWSVI